MSGNLWLGEMGSVMCRCRWGQRPVSAAWLWRCPSVGGLVHRDLCGNVACDVVCWILWWSAGWCLL